MQGSTPRTVRTAAIALLAAVAVTAAPAQTSGDRPAAQAVTQALPYVERPRISSLKVSPSNQHAAFLWRGNQGRLVLAVVDLAEPSNVRVVAGNPQLDISNIHWVNDRRLVFDARPPEIMIFEGEAGTFGVDIDGQRLQLLVSWTTQVGQETGTRLVSRVLPYGWGFFRALAGRGDEALFYQAENPEQGQWGVMAVARLDTATGQLRRASDGKPESSVRHLTDPDGNLRVVVTESGGRARVHHRPGGSREWEVVEDLPLLDASRMDPLYVEADGSWVVSSRRGRDADALFVYDPKTRKLDPEPLVAAAGFDMGTDLEVDAARRTVVGVHIETSQPQTVWLDDRLAQLQRTIDAALPPGRMNRLLCGDCPSAQRFVVHSQSDRQPGEYFVEIRDASDTAVNKFSYTVAGDANVARSLERNAELSLSLSQPDYRAGSEIEIGIVAPYTGSGLITIERDRVYAHTWFRATTTSSVQKIRIPDDFEGSGYVNVQFIRDPASEEIFMSPLSYAVAPFSVDRGRRTQPLALALPPVSKPGADIALKLTTEGRARVVAFAIDEGILQVARYQLADPLDHFFRKKMLDVETSQILDLILPEFSRLVAAAAPGGAPRRRSRPPRRRRAGRRG